MSRGFLLLLDEFNALYHGAISIHSSVRGEAENHPQCATLKSFLYPPLYEEKRGIGGNFADDEFPYSPLYEEKRCLQSVSSRTKDFHTLLCTRRNLPQWQERSADYISIRSSVRGETRESTPTTATTNFYILLCTRRNDEPFRETKYTRFLRGETEGIPARRVRPGISIRSSVRGETSRFTAPP